MTYLSYICSPTIDILPLSHNNNWTEGPYKSNWNWWIYYRSRKTTLKIWPFNVIGMTRGQDPKGARWIGTQKKRHDPSKTLCFGFHDGCEYLRHRMQCGWEILECLVCLMRFFIFSVHSKMRKSLRESADMIWVLHRLQTTFCALRLWFCSVKSVLKIIAWQLGDTLSGGVARCS